MNQQSSSMLPNTKSLYERIHRNSRTLIVCTLGLASIAFGQPPQTPPPTTDPPSLSEPMHTVIPLHLDTTTGDIKVGRTTYHGVPNTLHILVLSRNPSTNPNNLDAVDLVADGVFNNPSAFADFVSRITTKEFLLIINAPGFNYGIQIDEINPVLQVSGGQQDLRGITSAIPFVFIGTYGAQPGGALQRGYVNNLPVDGYLAADAGGTYGFIQTDYVRYGITTDGTIKIAGKTYTTAGASSKNCTNSADLSNSFHLLVIDRLTLSNVSANNVYCTTQDDKIISSMATYLSGITDEGLLVLIASNGHPIPTNWKFGSNGDSRIQPLAHEFGRLGGYWETGVYLTPSDTYSLVGAAAPPPYVSNARSRARESSTVYCSTPDPNPCHATGDLHGVLARGRANYYSPINADTTGVAEMGLYDIMATSSGTSSTATFPQYSATIVGANTESTLSAYQRISQLVCGGQDVQCPNIRSQYGNDNIDYGTYHSTLIALATDPNNKATDCTQSTNATVPFCQVRQDLLTELDYADRTKQFHDNLKGFWDHIGTGLALDLDSVWQTVQASVPAANQQANAASTIGPIVNLILGLADAAPGPQQPFFGIIDACFNFGMSFIHDDDGNQTASLAIPVADLADKTKAHFDDQRTALGIQFDLIFQNWGKLQAIGQNLAKAQQGSVWFWDDATASAMASKMNPPVKQAMFRSLLPNLYSVASYMPQCNPNRPDITNAGLSGRCLNGWGTDTSIWAQPWAYIADTPYGWNFGLWAPFLFGVAAQYQVFPPYTFPTDTSNPAMVQSNPAYNLGTGTMMAENGWLAIGVRNQDYDTQTKAYSGAPGNVLQYLFKPVQWNGAENIGGLGVYRPAFFESWPFARAYCDTSADASTDDSGCHWNSGSPALEALAAPLTGVSSKLESMSRNGTRLDVRLTISNTGSKDFDSLEISEIGLLVPAGERRATLVGPNLPIRIDKLGRGVSTTISLTLNAPLTVKSHLQITMQGKATDGGVGAAAHQFRIEQTIYP